MFTLLIDGNSLLKRSYHGSSKSNDENGATWSFLCKIRKMVKLHHINKGIIFWDGEFSGKLKHNIYPDYKKNRNKDWINGTIVEDEKDIEIRIQRIIIKDLMDNLFFQQYTTYEGEADDAIAYYTKIYPNEKYIILTGDSDLLQLLDENIYVQYLNKEGGFMSESSFMKKYEYSHKNIPLLKSIVGDTADCIKGLTGWSDKGFKDTFGDLLSKEISTTQLITKAKFLTSKRLETKHKPLKKISLIESIKSNELHKNMFDIINLHKPILTDLEKKDIENLKLSEKYRKSVKLFKKFDYLKFKSKIKTYYYTDSYTEFVRPFFNLINHYKNEH